MIKEIKLFRLPLSLISEQKTNLLTRDLYLTETGEIEVGGNSIWVSGKKKDNYILVFCTKGEGIVFLSSEQVPVSNDQYFIVPPGEDFKFFSPSKTNTFFLVAGFNGRKVRQMGKEFLLVRNLVPSVNNMVANREMLFEEIFNNLAKGFHDQNLKYVKGQALN